MGVNFAAATSSQVFFWNTFKKKMGAVKTSSIEITKCHTRENKSWKFCETHLHSKNFYSISCLCKEKFLEIDENEKVLQYWKGGSLTNLLRIFSLVLERCTHCGRNSSTDCNGLLRFYSLVWGYKVSLSTFMRDISRHLGFMGCGLLVHYYIPKGVVVVQYAVYSPDIFLILHLLFPDFLCISTMRTKTKYCKKSFKRLPRFRLSKGDFL